MHRFILMPVIPLGCLLVWAMDGACHQLIFQWDLGGDIPITTHGIMIHGIPAHIMDMAAVTGRDITMVIGTAIMLVAVDTMVVEDITPVKEETNIIQVIIMGREHPEIVVMLESPAAETQELMVVMNCKIMDLQPIVVLEELVLQWVELQQFRQVGVLAMSDLTGNLNLLKDRRQQALMQGLYHLLKS